MAVNMDLLKHAAKLSASLLLSLAMVSCASHEAVPNAYSTPKATPALAGANAVTDGLAAGTTAGAASMPVGAAIGGVIGGAVGYFADRPANYLKKLAHQGVQVIAVGQSVKLIIFTDSCFDFGTSTLTNKCDGILANTAAFLKLTGTAPIKAAGYTDNVFGETFALRLSQEQADSVVAYLWAHGIPQQRFYAKGYGSADPIATNYTSRGNGLNRRVEISVG